MSADDAAHQPQPSRSNARDRSPSSRLRSRHNARLHGLTAALPDSEAEAAAMQGFADRWADELRPEVEAEGALIRASAAAFARLERCRVAEDAALEEASRDAVRRWARRKQHAARRKAQDLRADPVNVAADLQSCSFGCEWLQRHWSRLDARLAQGLGWHPRDQDLAMTLRGYSPDPPGLDGDPAARAFYHLMLAACGLPTLGRTVDRLPTDPVAARSALRGLIAREFDRLEALRERLWQEQDGPEGEAAARTGRVDTSKEGQLRQRYRREAFSEMVRGLDQVMRIRVERSKDDDRQWRRAHSPRRRAEPQPTPPPPARGPEPPASAPEPPASPAAADHRNEPPRTAPDSPSDRRKPNDNHALRNDPPAPTPAAPERTGPNPGPSRAPSESPRTVAGVAGVRAAAPGGDRLPTGGTLRSTPATPIGSLPGNTA
ncbi:hypothetical protein [Tautonia plasticadhaerens]|uniref:Uncharacterized protein n=1 Tax=Tautonia plasticadhaerens TaxID=2527974 RepID=A0A518H113_9BACT|nr:hypothetical protein [Tautonia plasticadhaerens]QDV34520.1 hypothetical protein ElP_24100 [Tautonia plasticadhaerens]